MLEGLLDLLTPFMAFIEEIFTQAMTGAINDPQMQNMSHRIITDVAENTENLVTMELNK